MDDKETLDTVRRALVIVKDAKTPDDLRVPVFNKVWEAIAANGGAVSPQAAGAQANAGDLASLFAKKLGVDDATQLQDIFEEDENGFKVVAPVGKLPPKKSDVTVALILLICAGRQIKSGTPTSAADVREQGKEYGKFDAHNFATIVQGRDDFWIITGSAADRTIKLRNDGWKKAGALLRAYASGGKNAG